MPSELTLQQFIHSLHQFIYCIKIYWIKWAFQPHLPYREPGFKQNVTAVYAPYLKEARMMDAVSLVRNHTLQNDKFQHDKKFNFYSYFPLWEKRPYISRNIIII